MKRTLLTDSSQEASEYWKSLVYTEDGVVRAPIFRLGTDVSLKVFSWCLDISLFQGAARVCKFWNGLIMDENNQKRILFRAVQCAYVDVHYRKGDLKLARNACEKVYNRAPNTIVEEDREYFVEKERKIIQLLETSEEKIAFILQELTKSRHGTCREFIECLIKGKEVRGNIELLLEHFEEIIKILIKPLDEDKRNKGYGLLVLVIIEKMLPGMGVEGKIRVINALTNLLKRAENKGVCEIMMQEAMAIYKIIVSLSNEESTDLKYNVNCFLGHMINNLTGNSSIYQRSFWDLLLSRASKAQENKEFTAIGNISFAVLNLLETKDELLNIYSKEHIAQIIAFLKDSYFYIGNKDKYSFFYALRYVLISFKLDLGSDELQKINSVFDCYIESKLSSLNGVKSELMKRYTQGLELDSRDAKILIEKFPLKGLNEETFISFACGIPGKLINHYTEEAKLDIINLFKTNIETKEGLHKIQMGFNIYLEFFTQLALNSKGKVREQATLLIGMMILRCSEYFSDRIWPIFFNLIFDKTTQTNPLIRFIERAISNSDSMLSLKELNFAEKIREIFVLQDKNFIKFFNEYKEEFYKFLDGQLLNIRKNSIKTEVILTLIYIILHPEIKDPEGKYKEKFKFSITNQLKWTPSLKTDIKNKIKEKMGEIVKFCEEEKFNKFLSEELGIR